MWIFMHDAMLSIVTTPKNDHLLTVRARAKGDIERVFERAKVTHTPERDYAYRAFIPRKIVAAVLSKRIHDIDTPNFKNAVKEDDRHDAYAGVWSCMMRFQTERARPKGQGLFRKQQTRNSVWEGLPADNEDDLIEAGMGMPDWEPKARKGTEDDEDAKAWDYMRKQGWVGR